MEKKPRKLNRKSFCIATLRRASYRWPPREEARKLAKIGRNQYLCAHCPINKVYKRRETQLDHVEPIIPVSTGWISLDSFAERLLLEELSGYQVLCIEHHKAKTQQEKELRKYHRNLKKNE